jgi:hypothetical protein
MLHCALPFRKHGKIWARSLASVLYALDNLEADLLAHPQFIGFDLRSARTGYYASRAVYRDQTHLTGTFASSLAPAVAARLTGVLASSR